MQGEPNVAALLVGWPRVINSLCLITLVATASSDAAQHSVHPQLRGVTSRFTCAPLETAQHPEHRVCFFKNLLVYNGSLVYIGPDALSIPTINTEYWLGGTLQDWMTNFTSIDQLDPQPRHVTTVNRAALTDWPFYHNYFHVFAEYLPSLHNVLCRYWHDCSYDTQSDLEVLLLTPGIPTNQSSNAVRTDAAKCLTHRAISALSGTANNTRTAVLLKDAIAGWGPECRADHWHCLPWELRRPPSHDIMELWRQRVGDCIGFDWGRQVTTHPLTLMVIDRRWNSSRHIVNIDQVMLDLRSRYPSAHVELHYLETLTIKQQALIYNRASIVMWVHGASMANLIFLPRRAVGLHIVPRPHVAEIIDWPEELVRDLTTEVNLIHINNTGPDLLPLQTSKVTKDWVYRKMNATEKLAIWEQGDCAESLKRPILVNDTENIHHYCEEYWFKTSIDVKLNMTAILPVIDDVIDNYFPSLEMNAVSNKRVSQNSPMSNVRRERRRIHRRRADLYSV